MHYHIDIFFSEKKKKKPPSFGRYKLDNDEIGKGC